MTTATPAVGKTAKAKWEWPKTLPDQMRLLRQALSESSGPVDPKDIARLLFRRAPAKKIEELLETLATLGHIRLRADGRYSGSPLLICNK